MPGVLTPAGRRTLAVAVVVGHFTLALTGLVTWIAFLATSVPALAWVSVAVVLSVAGLGMATLAGGLPEQRRPGDGPLEPQPATAASPAPARCGRRPDRRDDHPRLQDRILIVAAVLGRDS